MTNEEAKIINAISMTCGDLSDIGVAQDTDLKTEFGLSEPLPIKRAIYLYCDEGDAATVKRYLHSWGVDTTIDFPLKDEYKQRLLLWYV